MFFLFFFDGFYYANNLQVKAPVNQMNEFTHFLSSLHFMNVLRYPAANVAEYWNR